MDSLIGFDLSTWWRPVEQLLANASTRHVAERMRPSRTKQQNADNTDTCKETVFDDGHKQLVLQNGLKKKIFPSFGWTVVFHPNGDVKAIHKTGTLMYYFYEAGIHMVSVSDSNKVYTRFADGQLEMRDNHTGTVVIRSPSGIVRKLK